MVGAEGFAPGAWKAGSVALTLVCGILGALAWRDARKLFRTARVRSVLAALASTLRTRLQADVEARGIATDCPQVGGVHWSVWESDAGRRLWAYFAHRDRAPNPGENE